MDGREGEVIRARYGLDGGQGLTLQAIGDRYGITRERVRQIEAGALGSLRKKRQAPYFKSFVQKAVSHLKSQGGVEREDQYLENLRKLLRDGGGLAEFSSAAKFILELSGRVSQFHDPLERDWHPYFYLTHDDKKRAQAFLGRLVHVLGGRRDEVLKEKKFESVFKTVAKNLNVKEAVARSFLGVSKKFGTGPFGDFGLLTWAEVNPITARDWAYLILKREKKPLHFSELSKIISEHRKDRRTNLQTIHNEVIKDERFVLVGRGLYALREHGFVPGTAREIIAHLLEKHGPMPSRRIIELVKEQRFIKDATVLINLQNRKHFASLPDGRYSLREA